MFLLLLAVFPVGPVTPAQSTLATLTGSVLDDNQLPVTGATVVIHDTRRNRIREVSSDAQGRYAFTALEPTTYRVTARHPTLGVAVETSVTVQLGEQRHLPLVLLPAATFDTEVRAEPVELETTRAGQSRTVGERDIQTLPLPGRNFVDLVKLSPGVTPGRENVGGGPFKEPDIGVGAAAAPRIAFGGQTELNTLLQLDGLDHVQTVTGLPRATPSTEAVEAFRVSNATFESEYGRSLGGFVNILTKSGTNHLHGSLYGYAINDAVNARPLLTGARSVLRQHQFGATLGGPLQRDRWFFFASYEGQRRAESNRFSQVILSNLAAINVVRRHYGLTPETVDQLRTGDYDLGFGRVDWRPDDRQSLALRATALAGTARGFLGGGGRASPTSTTARDNQTTDVTLSATYAIAFTPMQVGELRGQWARRDFRFRPRFAEPALELPNLIVMGKSTSDVDSYCEDRLQVAGALTQLKGRHTIKVGGDWSRLDDAARWDLFYPARIIFGGLLPALLNQTPDGQPNPQPSTFWFPFVTGAATAPPIPFPFTRPVPDALLPNVQTRLSHAQYGLFGQDQWQATPSLTVTFGLRYDVETYPRRFFDRRDWNNLQPRVGVAWGFGGGRGVLRAGYGVFTDRIASSVGQVIFGAEWISRGDVATAPQLFAEVARFPGRFRQATISGPPSATSPIGAAQAADIFLRGTPGAPAGYGVAVGSALPPGTLPLPTAESGATASFADNLSRRLRNPYAQHLAAGVEYVWQGVTWSASYLRVLALKLPGHTGNLNAFQTGTLPTGKPVLAGRRFAELGHFFVTDNLGTSGYHGGFFAAHRAWRRGWSLSVAHTWSKTLTTVDAVNNLADYPEGLTLERFLSRQHATHRLAATLSGETPRQAGWLGGWQGAVVLALESGRPFNVFAGGDFNGDGNPNSDRPGLLPRNSFRGPGFASVDVRLGRSLLLSERLHLDITLDVFNAANRVNIRDLNLAYGGTRLDVPPNPSLQFGAPRDVFGARQLQIGVKLRF
ncbi:MAG: TonB-dependent receptor [Chloracidobacterium sp.]|uniref:TonB-dependent receptor n=1 Tax=Chloracidobacterium validum TaxID=2821543 RepID=A0ABX8BEZ8_9BACT|nr:TonB-dependent receptor [Chloracidobacterium validum]QUW04581.1 TonB-dependent receptor [Chloracidobacterium validum]